jgi:hypothetical protein
MQWAVQARDRGLKWGYLPSRRAGAVLVAAVEVGGNPVSRPRGPRSGSMDAWAVKYDTFSADTYSS